MDASSTTEPQVVTGGEAASHADIEAADSMQRPRRLQRQLALHPLGNTHFLLLVVIAASSILIPIFASQPNISISPYLALGYLLLHDAPRIRSEF